MTFALILALGTSAHLTVSVTVQAKAEVTIIESGEVSVVFPGGHGQQPLITSQLMAYEGQTYEVRTLHF